MTGPEADQLGARLALHLRKNEFVVCHHILDSKEEQCKVAEPYHAPAIAELDLDLRYINMLEKAGFIYAADLDHIDIHKLRLCTDDGRNLISEVGRQAISGALGRTWEEKND